jgi:hypothetical protein
MPFSSRIDLTILTAAQGFVVQGDNANDRAGRSVSLAGDINGDGIDDFIVGAYLAEDKDNNSDAGSAYVVFGKVGAFGLSVGGRQVVDLTSLSAAQGFVIQGDLDGDQLGRSVSTAGDINGDGLADLVVGAHAATGDAIWSGEA